MARRYKSITVVPAVGGRLMSRLSSDSIAAADYVVKRDWRRIADVESRREGYVPFRPNAQMPEGNQPWPDPPQLPYPISGVAHGISAASGSLSLINGLSGVAAGISGASAVGSVPAMPDPWSAQFNFPGGLNHNSMVGPRLFLENTSWSIIFWVLLENNTQQSFLASSWIGGGNENWFLGWYYPTMDRWYAVIRNALNIDNVIYGPAGTILNNTWHFVALVHDTVHNETSIYTDGNIVTEFFSGNKATISGGFNLSDREGIYGADQRMDEVAAFRRALTIDELDYLYNGGMPRVYLNVVDDGVVDLADCAGWWNWANTHQGVSPIDGSLYYDLIGTSVHPGGQFLDNMTGYSGGVLLCPYVGHANKAPLYP